jgi:hypothetical protein
LCLTTVLNTTAPAKPRLTMSLETLMNGGLLVVDHSDFDSGSFP